MRYKTISAYSFLAYLNQACNVFINLVFIKTLSLNMLGEVAIAKVWMQLVDYTHLGFRFALDRYVPVWDKDRSENLLWLCIVTTSAVTALLICVALTFTANPLLIATFIVWGYCVSITTILKNYYRASADNRKMLFVYAICPTIPVAIQAVAVIYLGFSWFLGLTITAYVGAVLYLLRDINVRHALTKLDIRATVVSVRLSALSMLMNSIIIFLSFAVDRVLLNYFAPKNVLGEYSVILFAFSLLLIVPSTLAEFIFPKIVSETANTGRIYYPMETLSIIVPTVLAIGIAFIAIPFAMELFPQYGRLTEMIQLIIFGIIPYAVTPVLFHVMNALDMRQELVVAASLVLGLYIAVLAWGGFHSENLLHFFTVARVAYGYLLLLVYISFLTVKTLVK